MKRACKATTKTGKPCKGHPLTGTDRCLAHSDAKTRESVGFIADNGKAGRPRTPRVVDVIRERIEHDLEPVITALFDALVADRGIALAVKGGGMEIGSVPDHETRIRAAREILDRAYGRPKQQTEVSGPDGEPIRLEAPTDHVDRSTRAARLLQDAGILNGNGHRPVTNGNGNGNGIGHH